MEAFQVMALLVLTCFQVVVPLNFNDYPVFFNFGDSNSDTGGLVAGVAFPVGPPNGETFFLQPSGRFCDGRLVIDFLMNASGIPFLNPYLDSVGCPSFRKGSNFATGGATIRPAAANSINPFSLGIQVGQFLHFKARAIELLRKGRKFQKYIPLEDDFKQGLYMLDIGQNDLDGTFYSKSEDEVVALIPTILSEFESQIQRLYTQGARNFWVHNIGPLGCLPRIIAVFGKNTTTLDQLGCVNSHNHAATTFNKQLFDLCTKFLGEFPDAKLAYVDIFSIKLDLISNSSQYGFKQPIAACCGYGGPPLNFDTRIACGQTKDLNGTTVTASPCNNAAEYVDWDGNHYTDAANRFIAGQILSGNHSGRCQSHQQLQVALTCTRINQ